MADSSLNVTDITIIDQFDHEIIVNFHVIRTQLHN